MSTLAQAQTWMGRVTASAFAAASAYAVLFAVAMIPLCLQEQCVRGALPVYVALWLYWLGAAALWLMLGAAAWTLRRRKPGVIPQDTAAAPAVPIVAATTILGVALGVRILVVLTTTPQLSDDMYRYVHDGRTLAHGQNPYAAPPRDARPQTGDDTRLIERINHRDLVTIYQPTSQAVFALLAALQPSWDEPFGHTTFRLGFVLLDLLIIAALMRRLAVERRPLWWATLYAWHPLAISEVASSGHQDVIGIFLLLSSLMLITPSAAAVKWMRAVLSATCFAAAIAVKPVVLPLAMPIAWSLRRQPWLLGLGVCVAVTVLVGAYMPFLYLGGGVHGLIDTVEQFILAWEHNSSVHALLSATVGRQPASLLCAGLLCAVLIAALVAGCDVWRTTLIYMFAAILLSTTAHPWYLLWALAFVPLRFSAATWMLSLTITWSYAVWHDPQAWHVPAWLSVCIYAPVYGLIAVEVGRWWLRRAQQVGAQLS